MTSGCSPRRPPIANARFKNLMVQALLIVDVQNDFLPGGALAAPTGDEGSRRSTSWRQTFGSR
jgi:hypothetical protein